MEAKFHLSYVIFSFFFLPLNFAPWQTSSSVERDSLRDFTAHD